MARDSLQKQVQNSQLPPPTVGRETTLFSSFAHLFFNVLTKIYNSQFLCSSLFFSKSPSFFPHPLFHFLLLLCLTCAYSFPPEEPPIPAESIKFTQLIFYNFYGIYLHWQTSLFSSASPPSNIDSLTFSAFVLVAVDQRPEGGPMRKTGFRRKGKGVGWKTVPPGPVPCFDLKKTTTTTQQQ